MAGMLRAAVGWADRHFGGLDFGDGRLSKQS
jgi:hypothetical protein